MSLPYRQDGYERLRRNSFESAAVPRPALKPFGFDLEYFKLAVADPNHYFVIASWYPRQLLLACSNGSIHRISRRRSRGAIWRRVLVLGLMSFIALFIAAPFFNPYSKRPSHYSGSNRSNETVFIAANIVDEELVRGRWGQAVLELIDKIGPSNAFLSIYENDSGPGTKAALLELAGKVQCDYSIVSGHIDLDALPSIQVLPGERRIKQMAYLAHVRNQALKPLDQSPDEQSPHFNSSSRHFDKLLFLNDVIFSPSDAADLLFATNVGADGKTNYHAACAMDFVNPFKFYDRFALRDAEYNRVGVPFFPWFSAAGEAVSWNDVIRGTDAVRVQSCWGGMVAFEAKWFRPQNSSKDTEPLRFRYEPEPFWDASECCLIHADLSAMAEQSAEDRPTLDSGIYVNPYIRVAYDETSFSWLEFVRHFERLFTLGHSLVDALMGYPAFCARRLDKPGEEVTHRTWIFDSPTRHDAAPVSVDRVSEYGHWESVTNKAKPGGYCGYSMLLLLREDRKPGQSMREKVIAPFDNDAEGPWLFQSE